MMRGSASTTAMSSRRPPMTAGPIERKRRFLSAVSYGDCAKAPAATPESTTAAAKMEMADGFLEGMSVSLNRAIVHQAGGGVAAGGAFRMELPDGGPGGIGLVPASGARVRVGSATRGARAGEGG